MLQHIRDLSMRKDRKGNIPRRKGLAEIVTLHLRASRFRYRGELRDLEILAECREPCMVTTLSPLGVLELRIFHCGELDEGKAHALDRLTNCLPLFVLRRANFPGF